MKNIDLANWLEHCSEYIIMVEDPLGPAIFEGILHMATTGQTDMLDTILDSAARNAVTRNNSLDSLLESVYAIKLVIWGRLEVEIDPEQVWDLLMGLEIIFQSVVIILAESYTAALRETHHRLILEATQLSMETEKKVMNYATQLARANRQLAHLEKAKTDFISIAAHELKTPLTVVQGYIDMLLEKNQTSSTENDDRLLNALAYGNQRLTSIVDDLLDVSAIETNSLALHFESVVLDSLIMDLVKLISKTTASRQHHFQTDIDPDLPVISTDPKRLYQVLERLLYNAVKYTPDGGKITLTACLESFSDREVDFIKIGIADTGIGISPEDREHIFDKFYRVGEVDLHSTGQVKFRGAGPGLGLSIAKGIVEALQGQMWAESPGYDEINCPGSTFYLRLPVST
jgi:signal transduction histidine kinase